MKLRIKIKEVYQNIIFGWIQEIESSITCKKLHGFKGAFDVYNIKGKVGMVSVKEVQVWKNQKTLQVNTNVALIIEGTQLEWEPGMFLVSQYTKVPKTKKLTANLYMIKEPVSLYRDSSVYQYLMDRLPVRIQKLEATDGKKCHLLAKDNKAIPIPVTMELEEEIFVLKNDNFSIIDENLSVVANGRITI